MEMPDEILTTFGYIQVRHNIFLTHIPEFISLRSGSKRLFRVALVHMSLVPIRQHPLSSSEVEINITTGVIE